MDQDLEDRYLEWLHSRVVLEFAPDTSQSYYELFRIMHSTEFVWLLVGDDNREAYGRNLRRIFLGGSRRNAPESWMSEPASVLEVLIALAGEIEFETDTRTHIWFWRFMDTLKLSHLNDAVNPDAYGEVMPIVDRFLTRNYEPNGAGGLFPLMHPDRDQRDVELWYQFSAYAIENELV